MNIYIYSRYDIQCSYNLVLHRFGTFILIPQYTRLNDTFISKYNIWTERKIFKNKKNDRFPILIVDSSFTADVLDCTRYTSFASCRTVSLTSDIYLTRRRWYIIAISTALRKSIQVSLSTLSHQIYIICFLSNCELGIRYTFDEKKMISSNDSTRIPNDNKATVKTSTAPHSVKYWMPSDCAGGFIPFTNTRQFG